MNTTPTVTILVGASGSGKSTWAANNLPGVAVASADACPGLYTKRPEGVQINFNLLPVAHAMCLRQVVDACLAGESVVVDNSNTRMAELAPYAALALAYGLRLDIVVVECNADVAALRNTHGVPAQAVHAMTERIDGLDFPPWWPVRHVSAHECYESSAMTVACHCGNVTEA